MDYFLNLSIFIFIYAILGVSLNLVIGYTGLISLSHAAFYGIGAYATAILLKTFGLSFLAATSVAILITALIAFLIGLLLSKFDGDYYMLVSLAFTMIAYGVFLNWRDLTGGAFGIAAIPRPEIFGFKIMPGLSFLILALVLFLIIYAISYYIGISSFGRVLKGIREDEKALQVFGYKTHQFKLAIFVVSAGMASVAGSLVSTYLTFIAPISFDVMESVFILAIIILGGLANIRGAVLGAVLLILLPELFRFIGLPGDIAANMRQVIYGGLLVFFMMYRPQGLIGEYKL